MNGKEPTMNREELVREKKKIISNLVLVLVAAFVVLLALGTMAWFANNKEVMGEGMRVSVAEASFELAVPDRTGADETYNDLLERLGYSTSRLTTEGGAIRWVMWDEDTQKGNDYRGLRPGSYGSLTFFILPNTEEDGIYDIQLNLTGYYAEFLEDNNNPGVLTEEIVEDSFLTLAQKAEADSVEEGEESIYAYAERYLAGHVLFFRNHQMLTEDELNGATDDHLYYSERIINHFVYNTAEHSATTWNGRRAYEITLYWIWPNTFGQIMLENGDNKLNDEALFSSKQAGETNPRMELLEYIATHPEYFFHSETLLSESEENLSSLMSMQSLNTTNALITLSNGYNGADQMIGENVQFFMIELTAELQ